MVTLCGHQNVVASSIIGEPQGTGPLRIFTPCVYLSRLLKKIEEDNRKAKEEFENEKRKEREKAEAVSLFPLS